MLNAEQASLDKVSGNKELQDIVSALGCGIGPSLDMAKLRYGRVFLLMDADSDGHHIATLLLHLLLPAPAAAHRRRRGAPLSATALPHRHRQRDVLGPRRGRNETELLKEKVKGNAKPSITRFKGLGEMQAADLKATTLDPKHRASLRVAIANELETDRVINDLLGRDVSARFKFIMERAGEVAGEELDV